MIVYNITIKVDRQIENDWLAWQHAEHIPEIMQTGMFSHYRFYRLLDQEDEDGNTFVVQYFAPDETFYKRYIEEFAPALREKAIQKWSNGFVAFRTTMELISGAG